MSLKEISDLLKDLIESNKQLTLRLKMIEIELNYIKENLLGKITNILQKTEKIDPKISQKYVKNLLAKKLASSNTYQKQSMDEKLIQRFLEKQSLKEEDNNLKNEENLYNLEIEPSENISEPNNE